MQRMKKLGVVLLLKYAVLVGVTPGLSAQEVHFNKMMHLDLDEFLKRSELVFGASTTGGTGAWLLQGPTWKTRDGKEPLVSADWGVRTSFHGKDTGLGIQVSAHVETWLKKKYHESWKERLDLGAVPERMILTPYFGIFQHRGLTFGLESGIRFGGAPKQKSASTYEPEQYQQQ